MKKHLLTILFVLGLSAAVAMAQSTAPGQVPSAAEGAQGSMQQQAPDRTQSGAQTQPSDTYGSMDKDKDKENDKKQSSMANVDDESLHRQVHEQLASNPDLQNVQITVKNGKVTLEGSVPKQQDKKEAERLAKAVPGVKGVKDRLAVSASAGSSGSASNTGGVSGAVAATTGSAQGENQSSQGIAAQTTTTTPSGSTTGASQSGQADVASSTSNPPSSASEPSAANPADPSTQSSVSSTSQSGQTSAPAAASDPPSASSSSTTTSPEQSSMGAQPQSGSMGAAAGDDQLQQQIQTALKNDPSLANDNLMVSLTADSIELSGDVATGKEKKTAQRIVESYAGNRKVKNNISVGGKGAGAKDSTTPSANPRSDQKPPQD
jgi:osmotically-inducible protein OsmY